MGWQAEMDVEEMAMTPCTPIKLCPKNHLAIVTDAAPTSNSTPNNFIHNSVVQQESSFVDSSAGCSKDISIATVDMSGCSKDISTATIETNDATDNYFVKSESQKKLQKINGSEQCGF